MNFLSKKYQQYFIYTVIIIIILLINISIGIKFQYLFTSGYFKFNNTSFLDKNIIIVALDDKTLNSKKFKTRFQDITRSDYANVLRNILYGDPKAVFVDTIFQRDSSNIQHDKELKDILQKNSNIVVSTEFSEKDQKLIGGLFVGDNYPNLAYINTISYNNLDNYNLNLNQYKNKIPIYFQGENPVLPASIKLFTVANQIQKVNITSDSIIFDDKLKFPLQDNDLNINFFGSKEEFSGNYQIISFIDILSNEIDNNIFKNKVVLIGSTAHDLHDEFYTPYDTSDFMPGVMIHANAYNTLSANKNIIYPSISQFILINLIFLILILFINLYIKSSLFGTLYSTGVLVIFGFISFINFKKFGYFIEASPFISGFIFLNLFTFINRYIQEKNQKLQIKNMFMRYVSQDVVNQLVQSGIENLSLGGTKRHLTVFFSDLVGFTDLSENLDPENLGKILNIYFETMSSLILENRGTIDKFIGDAIMCFWNAPLDVDDHAYLACKTALLQRKGLDIVRAEIKKAGANCSIDMRIGVNSGDAVVGNFGCNKRYDYTILGDTVNLASRLEGINKQYGTKTIINETTYERLSHKEEFIIRELDYITVKGKIKPIRIYELVGFTGEIGEELQNNIKVFGQGLELYRQKKFAEAIEVFKQVPTDEPAHKFIDRCTEFLNSKIDDGWDGVYRFKVK